MKLQQGQVWKCGTEYIRITRLERLEVEYKSMVDLVTRKGTHHHISKKAFCRLIKSASLIPASDVTDAPPASSSPLSQPQPKIATPVAKEN